MSQLFDAGAADDLVRLWQETTLPAPDPERLARRVARLALTHFDRAIGRRNIREYAGFVALFLIAGWQWMAGGDRVYAAMAITGGVFVVGYLWWQHRQLAPLDPSADARRYQAALLARIDHQIRLLGRVRYWYLLPLYLPVFRVVATTWDRRPKGALFLWVLVTGVFIVIGWLNERVAVTFLRKERARVESIYMEEE